MAFHKALLKGGFALPECEKHFHDHDETWIILSGRGIGYWIDHSGRREQFELEEGDVWMIPAGFEHGSLGANSDDFRIAVFNGTYAPGAHKPGHYYVEEEGYVPRLQLVKEPSQRYRPLPIQPESMQGVVFTAKGEAALEELPLPTLEPGHILCKTLYSGLTNGTERNVLMGGNYGGHWPARPGYQNVGQVIACGPGVAGYKVDDLVYAGKFHGHQAYFSADVSQTDDPWNLVCKLSADIDPTWAALYGMAGVALHDVRRAQLGLGDKVLVVGAGSVGLCTAQIARANGAQVTICDLNHQRLDIAQALGIRRTVVVEGEKTWAALQADGPFDAVFEDSGAPLLDHIIGDHSTGGGLLPQGGKVVVIAGRDQVNYNFNAGQQAELTLLQASHFRRDDLLELDRLVGEGLIQLAPLIQEILPYGEAPALYRRLRDAPETLLGTVFDWRDHP